MCALTGAASGQVCGDFSVTQNTNPTVVDLDGGNACQDQFNFATKENRYARSYDLSMCPFTGHALTLKCVNFAVEVNTQPDFDAVINIYEDIDAGAPVAPGMDLVLLGSTIVTIPVVDPMGLEEDKHFTADFSAMPVNVAAGTTLVVEIAFADRSTTDLGIIVAGANNDGETQSSYILAPECAVPTYATPSSLGLALGMIIQVVHGDLAEVAPCPGDCSDPDGSVGIADFLAILAQWGAPGGCDFAPDGGNGLVGIDDFLEVLGSWGPCPVPPPFCNGDSDNDNTVGINDFLNVLSNWGTGDCSLSDLDFDGSVGVNDFLLVLAEWGPCPG